MVRGVRTSPVNVGVVGLSGFGRAPLTICATRAARLCSVSHGGTTHRAPSYWRRARAVQPYSVVISNDPPPDPPPSTRGADQPYGAWREHADGAYKPNVPTLDRISLSDVNAWPARSSLTAHTAVELFMRVFERPCHRERVDANRRWLSGLRSGGSGRAVCCLVAPGAPRSPAILLYSTTARPASFCDPAVESSPGFQEAMQHGLSTNLSCEAWCRIPCGFSRGIGVTAELIESNRVSFGPTLHTDSPYCGGPC